MSLVKKVQQHIHQHRLFKQDDRLLLAVSGGLDSVLMLEILHQLGYNITVAHCNFNLRGVESDDDEKFVVDYCGNLKIPVYQHTFQKIGRQLLFAAITVNRQITDQTHYAAARADGISVGHKKQTAQTAADNR